MTTEQSKPTQRIKLTIKEVQEPKEYKPGRKVVNFTAIPQGSDKALRYACFRDSIIPILVAGQTIEADVETRSRQSEDPERPYIDRTVQQVYVDGQPVGGQKGGFGGPPRWGKTPEQQAEERRSIEGQVALKEVGELVRAGIAIDDLKKLYLDILWAKLNEFAHNPASPSPSTGGASTTPAARPVPAGGQPGKPAQAVLAKAEPASEPPDAEWDGLPSAEHPSAPAATAAFTCWGDVASWSSDYFQEQLSRPVASYEFFAWATKHLGRKIGAWPSFGNPPEGYAQAVLTAREYVAAQQEG